VCKAQLEADWRCLWQVLNALLNTTEFQVSLHALKLDGAHVRACLPPLS